MRDGWTYKKLGEVAVKISDGSHNPPKGVDYSPYPMLSSKNVFFDYYNYDDPRYLSKEAFEEENKRTDISDGDVLLTIVGTVGRTCCVKSPFIPFTLQRSVAVLKPKKESIASRFLMYALHSLSELWNNEAKGVAQKGVYLKQLASIPIPIPPLSEQQRIVSELDLLSSIIEKKKAQLKEYDQLAHSIFFDMFGDPVSNEKGWEVKKLGELALVKTGPFGSMLHKQDYISNGTPLVNPIHMKDFHIIADMDFTISDEKAEELDKYILQKGDVIFARRGDIGRCAVVTEKENGYLCGTGSLFVRFVVEVVSTFIMYIIRSSSFTNELVSNAKGATMLNLNSSIVEDLRLPLPPLPLQQSFTSKIKAIERQKALIQQSITEVETLFNSRMDYYFN